MKIGIEKISFYIPEYYLDIKDLAVVRGCDPDKYVSGIGQEKMAVLPINEDIVTMAASAASNIIDIDNKQYIDLLIFATESSYEQSKACGIYVHRLLELNEQCRIFEVKQACYASTAALRTAIDYIKANPNKKALVVASDVSRYGLNAKGEFTQGCGAVAMLVSANPMVASISEYQGYVTKDIMDFWSPNHLDYAMVDGQYSTKMYLQSLLECWDIYKQKSAANLKDFSKLCFHLPFCKIAEKSTARLYKYENLNLNNSLYLDGIVYNKQIGNAYSASLYISLIAMLENSTDNLADNKIGVFAYGSGMVAEFFDITVSSKYKNNLLVNRHQQMLQTRKKISVNEYEEIYNFKYPTDDTNIILPEESNSPFVISEFKQYKRIYKRAV